MLIINKEELIRLKLTHNPPGKILEFAHRYKLPRFSNDPQFGIYVLVSNVVHEVETWLTIFYLEDNNQLSKIYSGYYFTVIGGDPDVILEMWKTEYINESMYKC